MHKPIRMLDIIAILRAARQLLTAARIAERLETSRRTIYRDIAALQSMGVPIDGAAGLGYILRPGFHLPSLNFSAEEAEALVVGLALLQRTGDRGLTEAAQTVAAKIAAAQPVPASDKPMAGINRADFCARPRLDTAVGRGDKARVLLELSIRGRLDRIEHKRARNVRQFFKECQPVIGILDYGLHAGNAWGLTVQPPHWLGSSMGLTALKS